MTTSCVRPSNSIPTRSSPTWPLATRKPASRSPSTRCTALGRGDIDLAHDGFKGTLVRDGQHIPNEIFEPVVDDAMKRLRQGARNVGRSLEHVLFCRRRPLIFGQP